MCGIAALFAYRHGAPRVDPAEVRAIRDAMASRGPDGEGEWFSEDGRVGLAHRRLSIIDLSATGSQPMAGENGRRLIVFNGEIYNYRELRSELASEGCRFVSTSDTEVALRLYERRGEAALGALRGMFAFALWDGERGGLLLARDPFGIKPLYYADDGRTVRAASQVRALRAGGRISRDPEPAGIAGFFLWGSVPEPWTLLREVRQVPAGHSLWIDEGGPGTPRPIVEPLAAIFLSGAEEEDGAGNGPRTAREALLDSVRHHLVSDVPVGAFLSAGIDSTAIVSLAREVSAGPLRTVTLAFEEFRGTPWDESPLAEATAARLATDHETRVISRERFAREIPRLLAAMDQPSVDGVNSYFVSQAASESGLKVALSGLGGDELLGGYPSFAGVPAMVRAASLPGRIPGLGRLARVLASPLLPRRVPGKYAGLWEVGGSWAGSYTLRRALFAPWEIPALVGQEIAREGLSRLDPLGSASGVLRPDPGSPFARVSVLEASLYMRNQLLRDTDWAAMAHSLEVRVPLVDFPLWRTLCPLLARSPALRSKDLLAGAARPPLPSEITARPKTGFFVPIWEWLEQSPALDVWKSVPLLSAPDSRGSRRWGYAVFRHLADGLIPPAR